MSKTMTGAQMVIRALKDQGVDTIFGYPGGAVLPIYDEIFQQSDIKHILVRHEQGATHAAEGYARSTGKHMVVPKMTSFKVSNDPFSSLCDCTIAASFAFHTAASPNSVPGVSNIKFSIGISEPTEPMLKTTVRRLKKAAKITRPM